MTQSSSSTTAGRGSAPRKRVRLHRRLIRLVRRRPAAVALSLAALHVVLALLTFEPQPHTGGDNAAYITLAKSLLETGTYTEQWDPDTPPHTKYPPAFPLVLAVALALGLKPWVQLKLVVLAFSATAVAFSFLWMRRRRRAVLALAIGFLLAVAPGVLREGRWVLSDVPFWAFTTVALWAFDRLRPGDWRRFALGAAMVLLAYFTRSAGLPLVIAALLLLMLRRMWTQAAALTAIVGIPATAWWLRAREGRSAGYVSEFWLVNPYQPSLGNIDLAALLQRIGDNVYNYTTMHLPLLLTNGMSGFVTSIAAIILILGAAGWTRRLRRPGVAELFTPLYLGLICIWPAVWSGERFMLPALALILFYAGDMLVWIFERAHRGAGALAAAAAGVLLLTLAVPGLVLGMQFGRICTSLYLAGERYPCLLHEGWDDFFELAERTPVMLPDNAVVLNRKPRLFHQLSGFRGRMFPMSEAPEALFAAADSAGARYLIFDQTDGLAQRYLAPTIEQYPGAFCLIHVTPVSQSAVLGIRGPEARGGGGRVTMCGPSWVRPGYVPERPVLP